MDAYDLIRWRETYFGLDRRGAAKRMGVSLNALRNYEEGKRPIPKYYPLICDAIAHDLMGWKLPPAMKRDKKQNPVIKPSSLPRGRQPWKVVKEDEGEAA